MKTTTSLSQRFASRALPGLALVPLLSVLAASRGAPLNPQAGAAAGDLIRVTSFSVGEGRVSMQWSKLEGQYGYTVEYCESLGESPWMPLRGSTPWPIAQTQWTGPINLAGGAVFLRIRAEPASVPATIPDLIEAVLDEDAMEIRWQPPGDATSYNLYWAPDPQASRVLLKNTPDSTARVGLTNGYYTVTALTPGGESRPSQPVLVGKVPNLPAIIEAVRSQSRYAFAIQRGPDLLYSGEFDRALKRQHVKIEDPGAGTTVEVVSEGANTWARLNQIPRWAPVQNHDYGRYLDAIVEYLSDATVTVSRADDLEWTVGLRFKPAMARPEVMEVWRRFVDDMRLPDPDRFLNRLIEFSQEMSALVEIRISKSDFRTLSMDSRYESAGQVFHVRNSWTPFAGEVSGRPGPGTDDAPLAIPEALLLNINTIGGWVRKTHCTWAEEALRLLKLQDASARYAEVYSTNWFSAQYASGAPQPFQHHPVVLGAFYEDQTDPMPGFYNDWFSGDPLFQKDPDYYWKQAGYARDYHHYGDGAGVGLQFQTWFQYRPYFDNSPSPPPRPKPDDRYYDARDWAFGPPRTPVQSEVNRLSFGNAVEQSNRYSSEGNTNAYLMMGHVAHLLQDLSQPDHARNVAHPGSSKSGQELKMACHVVGAEAAIYVAAPCLSLCSGSLLLYLLCVGGCEAAAYGAAYGACCGLWCDSCRGYERIVEEDWSLSRITSQVTQSTSIAQDHFDKFFADAAQHARSTADAASLASGLGCDDFTLVVPPFWSVDSLVPNIPAGQNSEAEAYLKLTDAVGLHSVRAVAGLLQHFYEIVAHPPIVERVAVVQWEPNATPVQFGWFAADPQSQPPCTVYDSKWEIDYQSHSRSLKSQTAGTQPLLSADRPAYIFVLFGPATLAPDKGGILMESVELNLTGIYPVTGEPIRTSVSLRPAWDGTAGQYYWGSFQPQNCGNDPYTLALNIRARDKRAHFAGRIPLGNELDQNPATLAVVQNSLQPYFPWAGYEPGIDTHHKVTVRAAQFEMVASPDHLQLPALVDAQVACDLVISQKGWSCNNEPYLAPATCAAEWSLDRNITHVDRPRTTGSPADFGLTITLTPDPRVPGRALLTVGHVVRREYVPGHYEISVGYRVGEPGHEYKGYLTVYLEVL